MAETQEATVGYNGEFWLGNPTTLYELHEVQEFDIPEPGSRERVEKTHLKSPNWRREYIETFYEDSEFEVVINSRPRSSTDTLLASAQADGEDDAARPFKAVIPEDGEPASQIEGTCKCIGYSRGRVSKDGLMTATARFRVVTIEDIAAYEAPGG